MWNADTAKKVVLLWWLASFWAHPGADVKTFLLHKHIFVEIFEINQESSLELRLLFHTACFNPSPWTSVDYVPPSPSNTYTDHFFTFWLMLTDAEQRPIGTRGKLRYSAPQEVHPSSVVLLMAESHRQAPGLGRGLTHWPRPALCLSFSQTKTTWNIAASSDPGSSARWETLWKCTL